ncbi:Tetratricopeptide repeat protein [Poriferisphaera corsica]|uniref:Tetratricopeptide repeat protein n=1 Tax=Poriferisphaera corsica TaxID=2528020 RepID=A0A517YVI2_9BACT|nr:hypothetical protein [Poriferisphaera corsica]QDU34233.1 Tetratricopeptide repeat protein [Poriferisphaera corsica]
MQQFPPYIRGITSTIIFLTAVWVQSPTTLSAQDDSPPVPTSPLLTKILNDPINSPKDQRRLALFHGRYDLLDNNELTPTEAAQLAIQQYNLNHPSLTDPQTPANLRAKAALLKGNPNQTLQLIPNPRSIIERHLVSLAYLDLGQPQNAIKNLQSIRKIASTRKLIAPINIIAAAESLVLLARLEGRPAQDWQLALNLLTKIHQEQDPLYWPAFISEAKLLYLKDNRHAAIDALTHTLSLNPNASEAWHLLGVMSAESFDFKRANDAARRLRTLSPDHPLATIIEARAFLTQRDHQRALHTINQALEIFPNHRQLIALKAAAYATAFDDKQYNQTLTQLDNLMPNSHLGYLEAGRYLSLDRQYALAQTALNLAAKRLPNDAEPVTELGLLLIQDGQLVLAHQTLTRSAQLDPFNRRAVNSLQLVQDLLSYKTIETPHFTIRYKPGIDHVLATDISQQAEAIYTAVTSFYKHQPERKTQIDILPDEESFGVRITGMPEIWTVAAATGDCIALTPPRSGAKQRGSYDWYNVIQHEFTHTVTLSLTNNRIPHWLTEACAVELEITERDFETAKLLSWALSENKLFDYNNINWGFVRPETDYDRSLAYAQANWMLQYIIETYSHDALLNLLALYRTGTSDSDGLHQITGLSTTEFMTNFKQWATKEVTAWGLDQSTSPLPKETAQSLNTLPLDQLRAKLADYPDNPLLLHTLSKKLHQQVKTLRDNPTIQNLENEQQLTIELLAILDHFQKLHPIDTYPARLQAELTLNSTKSNRLIDSLKRLDSTEQAKGNWSYQLAKRFRKQTDYPKALKYIARALHREPYNPSYRQFAAALAIQATDLSAAEHHLTMLTYLEPEQYTHHLRLAAFFKKTGHPDKALQAARKAKNLNPKINLTPFLTLNTLAPSSLNNKAAP